MIMRIAYLMLLVPMLALAIDPSRPVARVEDGVVVERRGSIPATHGTTVNYRSAVYRWLDDGWRQWVLPECPDGMVATGTYWQIDATQAVEIAECAIEAIPVPSLTPRQIRLGLLDMGLRDVHIEALIDGIEDETEREAARITWRYATVFERDHPLIDAFAPALGLEPEQVDELFRQWSDIE